MSEKISEIMPFFGIVGDASAYGGGHINDSYITDTSPRYILQRINHNIFTNPEQVMENIIKVTEFLKKKIIEKGGDPKRETLTVIYAKDGKSFIKTKQGNYFRMYEKLFG